MTLSSVTHELVLVACAFFVTNVLSVIDRAMASTKPGIPSIIISTVQAVASPESLELTSVKEVARTAGVYLASSAVLVLTLEHILAISTKPAFSGLFLLFQVGNAVYASASADALVATGRNLMGFAALGMCASASLAVGQIPHLFERPRLLACIGAVVGSLVLVGPLIDESLLATISTRQHGDNVLAKWCLCVSLPIQMAAFAVWQPSRDTVSLDFNTSHLLADALSLAIMIIFLEANEWTGVTVPVRDVAVRLNLRFCVFLLGVLGAIAMNQKLRNSAGMDSKLHAPRPKSSNIIFAIAVLLLTGVYYLPLWFRASGRGESLAGLNISPFVGSIAISLIGLTSLQNFEVVPLAVAVIAPLALTVFYRAGGQLSACGFIGTQIIYGASIGVGIRYSSLVGQATEFLDTIGGVVDATRM